MLEQYTIHNEFLKVAIKRKGAELCSVKDDSGTEFIWQAGTVWPRHAPNLFPIIGSLLNHEYTWEGKTYPLSHHGFARNLDFDMLHQSEHSICFVLQDSEATNASYPFKFTFLVTYTLEKNALKQTYRVLNTGEEQMPVSFGGHPAFNASPISEYEIVFNKVETAKSQLLQGPYISSEEMDVINGDRIQLTETIFDGDALIFENLNSDTITLKHKRSNYKVSMDIAEFPYLGIWAKPAAPYVCLEPWQGMADSIDHNKKFEDKKGIVRLEAKDEIARSFTMTFES